MHQFPTVLIPATIQKAQIELPALPTLEPQRPIKPQLPQLPQSPGSKPQRVNWGEVRLTTALTAIPVWIVAIIIAGITSLMVGLFAGAIAFIVLFTKTILGIRQEIKSFPLRTWWESESNTRF